MNHTNIFSYIYDAIERNPSTIALSDGENSMTYSELFQKILIIENNLMQKTNIRYRDIVIIYSSRNSSYITMMLSLVKLGITYVPLEKNTPINLMRKLAKDIGAKYVITDQEICVQEIPVILFSSLESTPKFEDHKKICYEPDLTDAIYIISTSGSSGDPKGVIIEHHNLINLLCSLKKYIYNGIVHKHPCRIAVMASFSFDSSVKQIFMALCNGNTLIICPTHIKKLGRLTIDFLRRNSVDVLDVTPSLIESFSMDHKAQSYDKLSLLLCGGEILREKHILQARKLFSDEINIVNLYGPTECCVDVAYHIIPPAFRAENPDKILPIGVPIDNVSFCIDKECDGELVIEGECVGRGYTGSYKNSFETDSNGLKRYRTGDVCDVDSDGLYYITGRIDNQVKFRGYRVELDAIDNKIMQLPDTSVALSFCSNQYRYSCIYTFVKTDFDIQSIRNYLERELPQYMIPTFIQKIDGKIQINNNGKIDKSYYKRMMINHLETIREDEGKF